MQNQMKEIEQETTFEPKKGFVFGTQNPITGFTVVSPQNQESNLNPTEELKSEDFEQSQKTIRIERIKYHL